MVADEVDAHRVCRDDHLPRPPTLHTEGSRGPNPLRFRELDRDYQVDRAPSVGDTNHLDETTLALRLEPAVDLDVLPVDPLRLDDERLDHREDVLDCWTNADERNRPEDQ